MEPILMCVGNKKFAILDKDIESKNSDFIESIDYEYFTFLLDTITNLKDTKRASILLRTHYYHSLETMFSLLLGFVQAPTSIYAWVNNCQNKDLREIVKCVNEKKKIYTEHHLDKISWYSICSIIFYKENERTKKDISNIIETLTEELLYRNNIDEYNSIKHGFRIKQGGFSLKILNIELGKSIYGSSWIKSKKLSYEDRGIWHQRCNLNWSYERTLSLFEVTSLLIYNITMALKRYTVYHDGKYKYKFFKDLSATKQSIDDDMDIKFFEEPSNCIFRDKNQIITKSILDNSLKDL